LRRHQPVQRVVLETPGAHNRSVAGGVAIDVSIAGE
jgi:hypothetical protein